jgi:hypothetical protein
MLTAVLPVRNDDRLSGYYRFQVVSVWVGLCRRGYLVVWVCAFGVGDDPRMGSRVGRGRHHGMRKR